MTERANDNLGPFSLGADKWPGLSKLIEECGEVLQIAGKLIATGGRSDHWSGLDLVAELEKEIGDLEAAAMFFVEMNPQLDAVAIANRVNAKVDLFKEWHGRERPTYA